MSGFIARTRRLTPARIIIFGFLALILAGAALLTLPFATRDGQGASFEDALFTATSATCVTGLVVHDTYTYWTPFGQGVIPVSYTHLSKMIWTVPPASGGGWQP